MKPVRAIYRDHSITINDNHQFIVNAIPFPSLDEATEYIDKLVAA